MSDLIERLRAGTGGGKEWMELHEEAADEIERLRAGLARHVDRVCGLTAALCGEQDAYRTLTAERDALRARIEDAPILDGYQAAIIIHMGGRTINVVSADLVGKRVALVVLEDGG